MNTPGQRQRVVILGGGPAGVCAAWQLTRQGKAAAVVIEQRDDVGGNAGSFTLAGMPVDYGSHRLHPACAPHILADLRELLGPNLLDRPRHGRIRLRGRWIHFPLQPHDLAFSLPWSFGLGVARDALGKLGARRAHNRHGNEHGNRQGNGRGDGPAAETFTSVLERGLGPTICRDFYFPYAVKIWGVPPAELSATQAHRRVSAGSLGKMARKALGIVPGLKAPGAGRFYYPRMGYGQLSRAVAEAARAGGAEIKLRTTVCRIETGAPHQIEVESDGRRTKLEAEHVWSTLPVPALARLMRPSAPPDVLAAAEHLCYRAMVLIYLVVGRGQWTPFDAHYFPEPDVKLTRLSEPKNYSAGAAPHDRTILCGELPCADGDEIWQASDADLAEVVRDSLARCGLALEAPILQVETRRLSHAYPIYLRGYEEHFDRLDEWAADLDGVLTFGRQGLFAHDNTHHALAMAYAAVACLDASGHFDQAQWRAYRAEFAHHVVED